MCDNNSLIADDVAHAENSIIKNKALIYSGFQVGITFINRLNNNLKYLYNEIDGLKGENSLLKEDNIKLKGTINELKVQVKDLNGQVNKFNLMFQALAVHYPDLNEIITSNSKNNNELNNKTNNTRSELEEFILKLLDNVFKDNINFNRRYFKM